MTKHIRHLFTLDAAALHCQPCPLSHHKPKKTSWLRKIILLLTLAAAIPAIGQTRYVVVSDHLPEIETAAQARGGVVHHRLKYLKGGVVYMSDHAASALQARFGANAIIEPDLEQSINPQDATRGGHGGGGTAAQTIPWGINAVHAPEAWALYAHQGEGMLVGMVDTGIQPDHLGRLAIASSCQ